MSLAR
jgi:ATP-dependent Clp protease ATP-binding subunit ClpC